ncbi:hypothetical protein BT93_G0395 [Corymbia citriodora subsp. variegata]|nr:hypothetical protein BT93_G0395 [Corymbia citriodora subsp. variegata]
MRQGSSYVKVIRNPTSPISYISQALSLRNPTSPRSYICQALSFYFFFLRRRLLLLFLHQLLRFCSETLIRLMKHSSSLLETLPSSRLAPQLNARSAWSVDFQVMIDEYSICPNSCAPSSSIR